MNNATHRSIDVQCAEEWRSVRGWEKLYEVSDQGRVYSVRSKRILKTSTESSGHQRLDLMYDHIRRPVRVHVLVLEAFVGLRPAGMEACHENGNPSDNRLSNLRWDTKSENSKDRVRHGTHHATMRQNCPRGHMLKTPNLDPGTLRQGRRRCRACAMEYSAAYAGKRDPDYSKADERYARIMAGLLPVQERRRQAS